MAVISEETPMASTRTEPNTRTDRNQNSRWKRSATQNATKATLSRNEPPREIVVTSPTNMTNAQ